MIFRFPCLAILALFVSGCTTPTAHVRDYDLAKYNKAFAVSTNGVIGTSWGWPTVYEAIDNAIGSCAAKGGSECKVINVNNRNAFSIYSSDNRVIELEKRTGLVKNSAGVELHYQCSDITQSFAQTLFSQGHTYLDKNNNGYPCEWPNARPMPTQKIYAPTPTPASNFYKPTKKTYTPKSTGRCHYVGGYMRKGRYVRGYKRCR